MVNYSPLGFYKTLLSCSNKWVLSIQSMTEPTRYIFLTFFKIYFDIDRTIGVENMKHCNFILKGQGLGADVHRHQLCFVSLSCIMDNGMTPLIYFQRKMSALKKSLECE